MSSMDLVPELAERLDRYVPADTTVAPDWNDILRRAESPSAPSPRRRRRRLRLALVAVGLFLLLGAIATGTYLALRGGGGGRAAGLTIFTGDPTPPPSTRQCRKFGCGPGAAIGTVLPDGRVKILWRCPHPGYFCGDMTSMAWSADGRKLAFTMDEIGGRSAYVGLHIVDVRTGRDHQLPSPGKGDPARQHSRAFFVRFGRRALRDLGCPFPRGVAWSADGTKLAYVCGLTGSRPRTRIFVLRADGSHRRLVRTATQFVASPSLSPDGTAVAFATGTQALDSSVYVVNLDGSHRDLVAHEATGPAWSPDGRTIAYRAKCGLRLVTPQGNDVTTVALTRTCGLTSPGFPAWSTDSTKLAFAARSGVYVVNADGGGLTRVTGQTGRGVFGPIPPSWTPEPRVVRRREVSQVRSPCC